MAELEFIMVSCANSNSSCFTNLETCILFMAKQECNQIVAEKFFPLSSDGVTKIYCETDYFKRLDLLCARCGFALRGSYINALGKKFHLEHFT